MENRSPKELAQPNLFPELDKEDMARAEEERRTIIKGSVQYHIDEINRLADFTYTTDSEFSGFAAEALRTLEEKGATNEQLEEVRQARNAARKRREESGTRWNQYTGD